MKLKKIGKILFFAAAGVFCLLIVCVLLLFLVLPSPFEIKNRLSPNSTTADRASTPILNKIPSPSKDDHDQKDPVNANAQMQATASDRDASLVALELLMDERKPLSEACRSMRNIDSKQVGKLESAEFGKRFQDSLLGKSSDPLMESLKPVLKFTLIQPALRELISKALGAQPEERSSLMSKVDFYQSAYGAYQEMSSNKERMERILDHSYLTMMLGRALEAQPNLGRDPQVLEYCEAIEKQLNDGSKSDFSEEKKAFLDFLSQVHIEPQSIGFNPDYQTRLQIVFSKKGLHFNGGWIDEIFAQLEQKPTKNN